MLVEEEVVLAVMVVVVVVVEVVLVPVVVVVVDVLENVYCFLFDQFNTGNKKIIFLYLFEDYLSWLTAKY